MKRAKAKKKKLDCYYSVWVLGYNGDDTANDLEVWFGDYGSKKDALEEALLLTTPATIAEIYESENQKYDEDSYITVRVEVTKRDSNGDTECIDVIYEEDVF